LHLVDCEAPLRFKKKQLTKGMISMTKLNNFFYDPSRSDQQRRAKAIAQRPRSVMSAVLTGGLIGLLVAIISLSLI